MSEETARTGEETGTPLAVSLALAGASREKADAFLDDQRHHMREQLKEISLRLWELRLGVLLRVAAAFIGIAVAIGLALLVWTASQSDDVIIDSFSVPPDMAARGLTGEAVANLLRDKIAAMQSATNTGRVARADGSDGGGDLKVEIPETGVSVGEAYRFLRGWLGHETNVRGEIYRTANGIVVNARAGVEAGHSFGGPEIDLDALIQQVAESVYRETQPYRYARYLMTSGILGNVRPHTEEARAILMRLTNDPSPLERDFAWISLGAISNSVDADFGAAAENFRRASSSAVTRGFAQDDLGQMDQLLGQFEAALAAYRLGEKLTVPGHSDIVYPEYLAPVHLAAGASIAALLGDYASAARQFQSAMSLPGLTPHNPPDPSQYAILLAMALAGEHDVSAANVAWKQRQTAATLIVPLRRAIRRIQFDAALGNWQAVADAVPLAENAEAASNVKIDVHVLDGRILEPLLALAEAKLGDVARAQARIAATPGDCYPCLVIRAQIAGAARQSARSDYWFAKAETIGPSIPLADEAWGRELFRRGDAAKAIDKFKASSAKGPHFADPLEGWGEALMAKNRSDLALAKFAEAEKYAPNWGRLHLKWGEALYYSGKRDDAKAQLARAAALDLTPSEKSELAGFSHV